MTLITGLEAPSGTSLRSLIRGFVLTKQTEGKSPRTVEFYAESLERFLWYATTHSWSDDVRLLTEWHMREFIGYVASETHRWGRSGKGSETSRRKASHTTVHHYFVSASCFFAWATREGYIKDNPMTKIKVARPKAKVIQPYNLDEITRMMSICDFDYEHNGKFLGSRSKAMLLVFLDSGVRLSELAGIKCEDVDTTNGHIKVIGKGNKERIVRIGKVTQKALWRYMMHRPNNGRNELWLSEEGKTLSAAGIQSLVQRIKERAGVTGEGSVHKFRHTFAINFLRADRNVFNLQYLLGHSDLDMVRRYTSTLGMEDALRAHEKASPADLLGLK